MAKYIITTPNKETSHTYGLIVDRKLDGVSMAKVDIIRDLYPRDVRR